MSSTLTRAAALTALTAICGTAFASDWDWSEEFTSRHWRPSSVQWAQDISPVAVSADDLVNNFDPPTHEMWCVSGTQSATSEDCAQFNELLDDWLVEFMQLSGPEQIPANLVHFPQECQSICQTR